MKKATSQQLTKMKSLLQNTEGKQTYELRGIFSHYLQILTDIDQFSQFKSDFSMKLIKFDFQSDKAYITNEIKELMKSSIEYYSENL
jgi:hypothetical protein